MAPETRYARAGEVHIAYQVVGSGPIDLVYVPPQLQQVEHLWSEPRIAAFFERIARFSRLILFDRRGTGLSDPISSATTLEDQMEDVTAVLDAVGSERAALFAQSEGTTMAMLYAATHPERTGALVLYAGMARMTAAPGYDWPGSAAERERRIAEVFAAWGTGARLGLIAPSAADDVALRRWFGALERLSASPGALRLLFDMAGETDVRDVLPSIAAPTLVLHRRDDPLIDVRHSHYLAEHIPGARYVELEGRDNLIVVGDSDGLLAEVERFLTGTHTPPEPDRVLATVMFTDIVGSTETAARIGDRAWRELLARHDDLSRAQLAHHRGRAVKSLGDGFLATFDGPARAIRCALELREVVRELGVELRAGLHTGECDAMGEDLSGLAVHIGARVGALAAPSEVLVSNTVKDLVVGSGIGFADRGEHALKGVPGTWRLWAAGDADG
ncbi:MAG TPA: adenylate/guanylate cyclase domain-containing protein [Conexibacter sp.]|nr:adenylate/guanylate cyclase domain-containing protein [Conexibacter sp.]